MDLYLKQSVAIIAYRHYEPIQEELSEQLLAMNEENHNGVSL